MIVEDQLDRRVGRIGGVEKLEEFDEFATAMAILDQRTELAGDEVDAGQQADRAVALISLPCEGRVDAGLQAANPGRRRDRVDTRLRARTSASRCAGSTITGSGVKWGHRNLPFELPFGHAKTLLILLSFVAENQRRSDYLRAFAQGGVATSARRH
jgi:hypothetical protein